MKRLVLVLPFVLAVTGCHPAHEHEPGQDAPYRNSALPVDQRVADLVGRMTAQEKAAMLAGSGWMESQPNARLGIPAIKMADGPMGVRNWIGSSAITSAANAPVVTSTSFPSGIGMAASWDPELVELEGHVIGQETRALGRDMILAPTVNIARVPVWGRNFEGYGEDPYLAARMGVAFVKGVQAEKVIPSVKHFAANNEEYERHRIDETVDVRTLHEVYFPAFEAAVKEAGAWAVMNAYNKVNGQWCAENRFLLTDTLQKRWGFKGFVISDWGSTYSTAATVAAGMNLEMPGGEPMRRWFARPETQKAGNGAGWLTADKVLAAVAAGTLKQDAVDQSVGRILRVMFTAGLFDAPKPGGGPVDTPEQRAVARRAAAESIVLLKNERGVLPLKARTVAVIGPSASIARTGGGGSSLVRPGYAVTALDGITEAAGADRRVSYALGVPMQGEEPEKETAEARAALLNDAVSLARKSDAAVVVVGYSSKLESESFDRPSMDLPAGQDELIDAVAGANRNTIVVLAAGSPVTMRWIDKVPAVVQAWYGGQEAGHGLADVLFGVQTPSGKLPVTFPKQFADSTAYGNYPGENLHVTYAEGIYVGYRGFDKRGTVPLFPFGHGLSYTTFDYSGLTIAPDAAAGGRQVAVSLQVRNSGARPGAEVVQVYVHPVKPGVDRPAKELKGFRRVTLAPGQAETVSLTLDERAFSYFSPEKNRWVAEPGAYEIWVGASSRDIRLKGGFELPPQ